MNAIPYDRPEEDWEHYEDYETDEPLPGRPRRQFFNRRSAALVAVLVGLIGFYAGIRVEKTQMPSSSTTAARAFTAGGATGATGTAGAAGARTGATGASSSGGAAAFFGGARSSSGAAAAFGGGNASIGTVSAVDGKTLYVTDSSGNTIKVTLSSATKLTKSVNVSKSAVRPGDSVVVRGLKNSNGTLSATSLSDSGTGGLGGFGGFGGSGAGGGGGSSSGGSNSGSSAVGSLFGSGGGG